MAITDPQVIKFVNERIRVRAEQLRALKVLMDDDVEKWVSGVDVLTPDDPLEVVEDGRAEAGVAPLSGQDVNRIVVKFNDLKTELEAVGVSAMLEKASVRPLDVSLP